MSVSWYYVEGSERVGPVVEDELKVLFAKGKLNAESYVWKKGLENWEKICDLSELDYLLHQEEEAIVAIVNKQSDKVPDVLKLPPIKEFSWVKYDLDAPIFLIKIGVDRGTSSTEYGPYSMNIIKKLFFDNRVGPKTYIFTPGMKDWIFLADIPKYSELFMGIPPVIDEEQRRLDQRKPFIARMLFHDNNNVYEGVCRDISIGGVQVLVSGMNVIVGETINMNVHPTNSDYCFVAAGKIVRVLDGNQGFSLRFENLSSEAHKSIDQYVETA